MRGKSVLCVIATWAIACLPAYGVPAFSGETAQYDLKIESQPLGTALQEFAKQSGVQVIFFSKVTEGHDAPALKGKYTAIAALERLLNESRLTYRELNPKTIEIRPTEAVNTLVDNGDNASALSSTLNLTDALASEHSGRSIRLAQTDTSSSAEKQKGVLSSTSESQDLPAPEETGRAIPEILVKGKRSLNVDVERTEGDIQPYVVLTHEDIAHSGAANLEAFLTTRLPMNAQTTPTNRNSTPTPEGQINLRGLGADETLILVDGRRIPSVSFGGQLNQGSINGIPMSSIERIEILPSTASGIYGGDATGGVINIILKREYSGLDLTVSFENTSDFAAGGMNLSASGGLSLEEGRTQITFNAAYKDSDSLDAHDRNKLLRRSSELLLVNNPAVIENAFFPVLGYTPNVCAGTSFCDSAIGIDTPLTLDNGTALSSSRTFVPVGYAGPYPTGANDGGAAFVANAGGQNIDAAQEPLIRTETSKSAALNIRRDFSSRVAAFLDLYSDRALSDYISRPSVNVSIPAASAYNPFQQDIVVTTIGPQFPNSSELETLRLRGGVIARLPHDWSATLEYDWSQSSSTDSTLDDFATLTPSGLTYLESVVLRDPNVLPPEDYLSLFETTRFSGNADNTVNEFALRFGGPILALPTGSMMLNGLIERREDRLDDIFRFATDVPSGAESVTWQPSKSQDVTSTYLELRAPLASSINALPFLWELEVMAAVRYDEFETSVVGGNAIPVPSSGGPFPAVTYTDVDSNSTNYTLGFRYSPIADVALRASFGTGFRVPSMNQLVSTSRRVNFTPARNLRDPRRGNTLVLGPVNEIQGGNPDVLPEESESLSLGFIFQPRFLQGLRISLDYVQIDKTDEIGNLTRDLLLANEASLPDRVSRGPNVPTDQPGWAGPITRLDESSINFASTKVKAFDFQIDYSLETADKGDWRFFAIGTRQAQRENQVTPVSVSIDTVGYFAGPLEWRGNVGVDWRAGPWLVGWNAQYYAGFRTCAASFSDTLCTSTELDQGSTTIPSQTYHDLYATYRFDGNGAMRSWLSGTEISLSMQNVLNKLPPVVITEIYSSYGDPRLRRFALTLHKNFGLASKQ